MIQNLFQVFAVLALLPFVTGKAQFTGSIFDSPAPSHAAIAHPVAHPIAHPAPFHPTPVHHAPVHHAAALHHAPVHHTPEHHAPVHHAPIHHAPIHHAPIHHAPIHHPAPAPAYGHPEPTPAYGHPAPVHHAPTPAYGHPEPIVHHAPAPAYGHPAPAPAYGHPAPAPAYGHPAPYPEPTENCTVVDVIESAEVCTPTVEASCADVVLPIKIIVDIDFTYTITRTVCTESIQVVPQEVCTYKYEQKTEDTTAKTVEVTYEKVNNVQMITVCQAGGYGPYGPTPHYCQEVAQETAYNVPIVTPVDVAVTVAYPEPQKVCVDKPISLPVVSCADITEEKTIKVPTVEDSEVTVPECKAQLGAPACQNVELTLPKQVCKELVYGHAHEAAEHPPHPAHPAHAA